MASRVVVTYHTPVVAAGITGVGGLQPEAAALESDYVMIRS